MLIVVSLWLLFSAPFGVHSSPPTFSRELNLKNGGQALQSLQRLLDFFESDAKSLNVDGLYGLRIGQGQLNALNAALAQATLLTDQNHHISSLAKQIERIANVSLSQIEHDTSSYLHRFALIIYQPFAIEYRPRKLLKHLIDQGERSDEFDEDESDQCFGQLLGSNDDRRSRKCSVSRSCWKMMTAPLTKDYRLTHQLLWFLVAKNIGCVEEHLANEHLQHIEDYYCANIYADARDNLENNSNQDLFLEQLLLCSMIGYEEFLRYDWLEQVLAWQDPQYGCFSDASERRPIYRRHLLIEQEMNNGCLSHKGGLAGGLLATYTRVFLQ